MNTDLENLFKLRKNLDTEIDDLKKKYKSASLNLEVEQEIGKYERLKTALEKKIDENTKSVEDLEARLFMAKYDKLPNVPAIEKLIEERKKQINKMKLDLESVNKSYKLLTDETYVKSQFDTKLKEMLKFREEIESVITFQRKINNFKSQVLYSSIDNTLKRIIVSEMQGTRDTRESDSKYNFMKIELEEYKRRYQKLESEYRNTFQIEGEKILQKEELEKIEKKQKEKEAYLLRYNRKLIEKEEALNEREKKVDNLQVEKVSPVYTNAECKICEENLVNVILIPCGHTYCDTCSNKLDPRTCPTCRTPIEEYQKLALTYYFSEKCQICNKLKAKVCLRPCGHIACDPCSEIVLKEGKCPLDKTKTKFKNQFFISNLTKESIII